MQGVFRVPRITNTMLLEAGTHVLRELHVLLYLALSLCPHPFSRTATSSGSPRGATWAVGGTRPR